MSSSLEQSAIIAIREISQVFIEKIFLRSSAQEQFPDSSCSLGAGAWIPYGVQAMSC